MMSFPSNATPPNPARAEFAEPALLLLEPALHAPSTQGEPMSQVVMADWIVLFASQKYSCSVPFALHESAAVATDPPVALTNPFTRGMLPPSLSVQVLEDDPQGTMLILPILF